MTTSAQELAKRLGEFLRRDLIAIPLIKSYPHSALSQRCNLKSATLELDTSAFPSIEYVAGTRLGIYPANPSDHVKQVMRFLKDDVSPGAGGSGGGSSSISAGGTKTNSKQPQPAQSRESQSKEPTDSVLGKWGQHFGRDSLRMALTYLYDIHMPPTRDLLRYICDNCTNRDQKIKLTSICKSDDTWEKWICQSLRTLHSTFEEFNSCQQISAKLLLNELTFQQPRLYSISSIKSSKRFRAEIIVFQHRFSLQHISSSLLFSKEKEKIQRLDTGASANQPLPAMKKAAAAANDHSQQPPAPELSTSVKSTKSLRSLRSVADLGSSPISTHQVHRVPTFSGPLMSLYATSSTMGSTRSSLSATTAKSLLSWRENSMVSSDATGSHQTGALGDYEGLCSNYLLNLHTGDHIICEFVENPRFTLKGNRERPIMMIGQDVGVVAFRPFWQQRSLEYDRAQVFYTLFKDLSPKKFGDMQLVCLVGSRCKVEDLFKHELNNVLTHKILSSLNYVNKKYLISLLSSAATNKVRVEGKELVELGAKIAKLLIENNGCLYTCCDPQMTQAIEILAVESIAKNYASSGLTREKTMALLPKWKGRRANELQTLKGPNNQYVFTLENPFERAQIVQEIYDHSI